MTIMLRTWGRICAWVGDRAYEAEEHAAWAIDRRLRRRRPPCAVPFDLPEARRRDAVVGHLVVAAVLTAAVQALHIAAAALLRLAGAVLP